MSAQPPSLPMARLQRLASRPAPPAAAAAERCDLCAVAIAAAHRHLLEVASRHLVCVCSACAILFDTGDADGGRYRLIPTRHRRLADFDLDDALWSRLLIPVDLVFFFASSAAARVVAYYPSPLGAMESALDLAAWGEVVTRNPVLQSMRPDVEALLVHRAATASAHWLVPLDDAYALVGLIRTRWRGLAGGAEVRAAITEFFAALEAR